MTLIQTAVGAVRPPRRGDVLEALGIPYARAQRFGYPHPVAVRDFAEPFDAYQPAPAAPQYIRSGGKDIRQSVLMDEDCQNLSAITPADVEPGEKLPVMVYIHGGSYVVGSGDGAHYTPDALVTEHRVVLVRLTYRLGLLGFLGGQDDRPANLGLLDVREGLRWVKAHIAAFGGDPDSITLFGQSAGGDLIARLLVSEGVIEEGLVHRAIIQSAPLDLIYGKTRMATDMLARARRELAPDAPAEDYGKLSYSWQVQNPARFGIYRGLMAFGTQPGYYPLPAEEDLPAAYTALAGKVQLLVGANAREAAYFLPRTNRPGALAPLEPGVRYLTRHMYAQPAQRLAQQIRDAGGQATSYRLHTGVPGHPLASAHCTELGLLFDNPAWDGSDLHAGTSPEQRTTQGSAMRSIWATFARHGVISHHQAAAARISFT